MIADAVFANLAAALYRVPDKLTARAAGVSVSSAEHARRGSVPKTRTFLSILESLGRETALRVLEPLIGPADIAHQLAKLNEVERLLESVHEATVARLDQEQRVALGRVFVGEGGAGLQGGGGVVRGARRPAGSADAADSGAMVVTSIQEPLSGPLAVAGSLWRSGADVTDMHALPARMPERRVVILERDGADLRFRAMTPAFLLYRAADRAALMDRPITDGPDPAYARNCQAQIIRMLDSGKPSCDLVSARVQVEAGATISLHYRRSLTPWRDGARRFALCVSEPVAA